jgi:hypothetical protein
MWPFKKKKLEKVSAPKVFETVICIPGNWENWKDFILLMVTSTNGEYLAAGNILMNAKEKKHYSIEFCDHDKNMKNAFAYAGKVTKVTENFLIGIENHKHVIYISGATGNIEDARFIAFAAEAILKAGGLGIKIESAGKAFEKDRWHHMINNFEESTLYQMFVLDSIVDERGTVYSCGMHNLGFKDTIISGEEFQEAVSLISLFGYYQIIDKPTISDGQTFSRDTISSKYRITEELNQPNKGQELFENHFGMWRLTME